MTDFRETKIKILSKEHSRAFQEAVIAAGGGWPFEKYVKCLSAKFLFVDAVLHLGYVNSDSDYFDRHQYKEIQFPLPTTGHPHAELMAQYAEDAKTHAEPWKLWQIKGKGDWVSCPLNPNWVVTKEYRRKPKTHIIHGVEIPDLRVSPKHGDGYYLTNTSAFKLYSCHTFVGDNTDKLWTERGLTYQHTEEGKQAAILHAKAMLGVADAH